jgi:chitinase
MRRSVRLGLLTAALAGLVATVLPGATARAIPGLTAAFTKSGDWGTGYEGKYTISNASGGPVTWQLEFDLPAGATISSMWEARFTKTGNHVVVTGAGWNNVVNNNGTVSFGWIGAPGGVTPASCTVNGAACGGGPGPDTTPPTTPGTLSSPAKTENSVTLSWGASTDSGGSGLAGYNIYRNGATTPTAQTNGTATTFTDTGLVPNTTYTYVVRARDGAGNISGASNQISVTTNPSSDTTAPTVPGTLSSPSKTSTSVNLSWGASTDTGGSGLAGYNIYRNSTGPANPAYQTTGTATTFSASGLSPNTAYTFVVRARDGAGNVSGAGNQISVTTDQAQPGNNRRVGYFTQWGIYDRAYFIKNLDTSGQAAKLTHINYAFGNVNAQSRCFMANQLGQGDAWADYQRRFTADQTVNGQADTFNQPLAGNFNQIKQLKAKHPHLKVLISLGGWTWSRYFSDAALPQNRAAFVASCIDLFIKGNLPVFGGEPQGGPGSAFGVFDGVDLDWEWPGSEGNTGNIIRPEDKQNFAALVQEFRNQLNAYGATVGKQYLLTAFLPADPAKVDAGIASSVFNPFDFVTVQGYDFYGSWEAQTNHQGQIFNPAANPNPRKFSAEVAINKYLSIGAPADKLVLGVPAYGRGWAQVASTNNGLYQNGVPAPIKPGQMFEAGNADYKYVKNFPGTVLRDNTNGAVWKYGNGEFWSYDDPQLITQKGGYVRSRGLGGLMIWSLDGDDGTLVTAMQTGLQ